MFIILITKSKLESPVTIAFFCSYLCYHTRTGFDDCTGGLFARGIEDAGHPNFFPNNTFHVFQFAPAGLLGHPSYRVTIVTRIRYYRKKGQSPFATDLFFLYRSTGSKQTLNGLFLYPQPLRGVERVKISELFSSLSRVER